MKNDQLITDKQWTYCIDFANVVAEKLMEQDVSHVFGADGNSNFCLHVESILVAGTISLLSKRIGIDPAHFVDGFCDRVKYIIKIKSSKLKVIK